MGEKLGHFVQLFFPVLDYDDLKYDIRTGRRLSVWEYWIYFTPLLNRLWHELFTRRIIRRCFRRVGK